MGRAGRSSLLLNKSLAKGSPFQVVFRRCEPGNVAREIIVVSFSFFPLSVQPDVMESISTSNVSIAFARPVRLISAIMWVLTWRAPAPEPAFPQTTGPPEPPNALWCGGCVRVLGRSRCFRSCFGYP